MTSARLARWISGCVNSGRVIEILLRVEPDANACLHAPRAAFALVGAALRYRLDRQALGARARVVTADAGQPGINHIADARNGQRRLGDVGRDDDLAARRRARRRAADRPR